MARTIKQIQDSLIAAKNADAVLSGELTSASKTAVWLLWTYVVAFCQQILEGLFDSHKTEVNTLISEGVAHSINWYVEKAKAFQYGDALPTDSDVYAVINTDNQLIKYAAGSEIVPHLRIKVAIDAGDGILGIVPDAVMTALTAYFGRVKDAGVRLKVTTGNADDLRCGLFLYYDPLVLSETGARLDGTDDTPVLNAVKGYIKINRLGFNGLLVHNQLVRAIEDVEGIVICAEAELFARYGVIDFAPISLEYLPDSGYLLNDDDFLLANTFYAPHNPI